MRKEMVELVRTQLAAGGVPPAVEQKLEKLESDRAVLRSEVALLREREREREREGDRERERKREGERERGRGRERVRVCVRERERERVRV